MSTPFFPPELGDPISDGFGGQIIDETIRSKNAAGPEKVRARSSLSLEEFSVPYILTSQELLLLKSFYKNDCNRGATSFYWTEPLTNLPIKVRFKEPPAWVAVEQFYAVTISIEEV